MPFDGSMLDRIQANQVKHLELTFVEIISNPELFQKLLAALAHNISVETIVTRGFDQNALISINALLHKRPHLHILNLKEDKQHGEEKKLEVSRSIPPENLVWEREAFNLIHKNAEPVVNVIAITEKIIVIGQSSAITVVDLIQKKIQETIPVKNLSRLEQSPDDPNQVVALCGQTLQSWEVLPQLKKMPWEYDLAARGYTKFFFLRPGGEIYLSRGGHHLAIVNTQTHTVEDKQTGGTIGSLINLPNGDFLRKPAKKNPKQKLILHFNHSTSPLPLCAGEVKAVGQLFDGRIAILYTNQYQYSGIQIYRTNATRFAMQHNWSDSYVHGWNINPGLFALPNSPYLFSIHTNGSVRFAHVWEVMQEELIYIGPVKIPDGKILVLNETLIIIDANNKGLSIQRIDLGLQRFYQALHDTLLEAKVLPKDLVGMVKGYLYDMPSLASLPKPLGFAAKLKSEAKDESVDSQNQKLPRPQ